MSDKYFIIFTGIIVLGAFFLINKIVKLLIFTQEQKRELDVDVEEYRRQKRLLTMIQVFIIAPIVLILLFILVKIFG